MGTWVRGRLRETRYLQCYGLAYSSSATYFVEYQFPAVLLDSKTTSYASKTPSYASKTPSHVHQHVYEVMRVACKKMKRDGGELVSPILCDTIIMGVCRGDLQPSVCVPRAGEQQGAVELVEQ